MLPLSEAEQLLTGNFSSDIILLIAELFVLMIACQLSSLTKESCQSVADQGPP